MLIDIIINSSDKVSAPGVNRSMIISFLPLIFYTFTALMAILIYHRDNIYKNISFLKSINKMLIQEPLLWAINNNQQDVIGAEWSSRKNEVNGKLDAFCYYMLNTIVIVYVNMHKGWLLSKNKTWVPWKNYLLELMKQSTRFYNFLSPQGLSTKPLRRQKFKLS